MGGALELLQTLGFRALNVGALIIRIGFWGFGGSLFIVVKI